MTTIQTTRNALVLAMGALLAATAALASPVVVTYGGQTATDGSGLTSNFVPASNLIATPGDFQGYFIETFDNATQMFAGTPFVISPPLATSLNTASDKITILQPNNTNPCSFNSFNALNVTTVNGGMGIQRGGTAGVAANPYQDSTCFGYAPSSTPGSPNTSAGADSAHPAQISLDYNALLHSQLLPTNSYVDYIGFYLGSIDLYNTVFLYSGSTLKATVGGAQILGNNAQFAGNWTDFHANIYVNMAINANDHIDRIVFQSTGVAVEMDNVVVGVAQSTVPEPESLALVGLGLLGLVATRRKQVRG